MLTPAEVFERFGTDTDPKDYGVRVVPAPSWASIGTPIDPARPAPTEGDDHDREQENRKRSPGKWVPSQPS